MLRMVQVQTHNVNLKIPSQSHLSANNKLNLKKIIIRDEIKFTTGDLKQNVIG